VAARVIAMNHETITELFSAICPWLVQVWCLQRIAIRLRLQLHGWALLMLTSAIAVVVLLLPIDGMAIARWIAGVNANFSVPLIGILAVAVYEQAGSRQLFSERDWLACWGFGAAGGLALYPFALGVSSFDPYEWGWGFSPLFIFMGALTAWLIWKGNRFGFLLLLAVTAFQLGLLESTNYWDYLLDPVYSAASVVALARRLVSADARRPPLQEVP
jgi:hypothetical protein